MQTEMNPEVEVFAQGSPCSGVILYQWDGASRHMEVGLTWRTNAVGEGLGISFGGFAECNGFLAVPVGTIRPMTVEAYREGEEEIDAKRLHAVIPQELFERYAQPLGGFMVRTDDVDDIHAPVYYAFPTLDAERAGLEHLPDNPERSGDILWTTLAWRSIISEGNLAAAITLSYGSHPYSLSLFHHAHEVPCVLGQLALHAERQRLWNDRG